LFDRLNPFVVVFDYDERSAVMQDRYQIFHDKTRNAWYGVDLERRERLTKARLSGQTRCTPYCRTREEVQERLTRK